MNLALENCPGCGRAYAAAGDVGLCSQCFEERVRAATTAKWLRSNPETATNTDSPERPVGSTARGARVPGRNPRSEKRCASCGVKEPLAGADNCLGCQLALYKALGDLAAEVARGRPIAGLRRPRPMYVRDMVHQKRRRTGSYRFTPVTPSIKGR